MNLKVALSAGLGLLVAAVSVNEATQMLFPSPSSLKGCAISGSITSGGMKLHCPPDLYSIASTSLTRTGASAVPAVPGQKRPPAPKAKKNTL